jgi:L-amino acid N-acyltransferase YncA
MVRGSPPSINIGLLNISKKEWVMKKRLKLNDGTQVHIKPLRMEDLDQSVAFFRALPEKDRAYLRVDVTKRHIVKKRIASIKPDEIVRIVAVVDQDIIADGALEFDTDSWDKHVAELRLVVAHDYQRKGLGTLMARELFSIALGRKVEEIVAKFQKPQLGARKIMERLGFHQEAVMHNFVKDIKGLKHDLIIMRCDINSLWQKIEDFIAESEYRGRWQSDK